MALDVDPAELASAAASLRNGAQETTDGIKHGSMPRAGDDAGSFITQWQINQRLAALRNSLNQVKFDFLASADKIDAAGKDYTAADLAAAEALIGRGGGGSGSAQTAQQNTPTAETAPLPFPSGAATSAVDALTFARRLHAGPGPGASRAFAREIRQYLLGPHQSALSTLDDAVARLANWAPVGAAARDEIRRHRGRLEQIGTGLDELATHIDNYSDAFGRGHTSHPTPGQLEAARKELRDALASGDDLAIQRALAKYQALNAQSAESSRQYFGDLGNTIPSEGQGQQSTGGSNSMSALSSMLPTLLSSLAGQDSSLADDSESDDYDYGTSEYLPDSYLPAGDYGGYGSGGGGFGGPGGSFDAGGPIPTMAAAAMPIGAATANLSGPAPATRTPVIDPVTASPGGNGTPASRTNAPYMPYMPMAPGAGTGGANGGDRSRVVAWHPDRLIYVDDTPHTELVIGEKPSITPTVTPPTPSTPAPTRTGGSA